MTLDDWAHKLQQAGLNNSTNWDAQSESEKDVWRRAANVLLAEQARLIAIERALQAQSESLAPWTSVEELYGWAEVSRQAHVDLDRYLREIYPDLPEHYGRPEDGVRQTFRALRKCRCWDSI